MILLTTHRRKVFLDIDVPQKQEKIPEKSSQGVHP